MKELLGRIYSNIRLIHYQNIFRTVKEKAGSLSATEAFSADVIHLLGGPTLSEFAEFLGISQPNATYKVNALVSKGYVVKAPGPSDRRESILNVTQKFLDYYGRPLPALEHAAESALSGFSDEQRRSVVKFLGNLCELKLYE